MSENTVSGADAGVLNIERILALLPHRYPFLLVDRVLDYDLEAKRIRGLKNVTINEPFFQGHFPDHPVMPGVLIIEAMAQVAGVLAHLMHSGGEGGGIYYLAKVDNARFSRKVVPGDQVVLEAEQGRVVRGMAQYRTRATVDGAKVASAELLCSGQR